MMDLADAEASQKLLKAACFCRAIRVHLLGDIGHQSVVDTKKARTERVCVTRFISDGLNA
jgi:hypothetical protein